MEFAAELRDIYKSFPGLESPALRNLSLKVPRNSVTAIVGPNGSGKTTLLRILALLEQPDRGSMRVLGEDMGTARENLRERIAMAFQQPVVFDRTVYYNIAYPLNIRKQDGQLVHRTVEELGKRFGLGEFLHRNARTLSGGQKQRVAIARTLAAQPDLILLDEPNNNLDREGVSALRDILATLKSKGTAVVSTPNLSYAYSIGDYFAILEDGGVSFSGNRTQLDEHTAHDIQRTPDRERLG